MSFVGNRTDRIALQKRPGISAMPSSAYFRRQADICLRLSLIASDEEVSSRLIKMSREYLAKGDALAGGEADVTTLTEACGAARPAVSQHLARLRLAGLVNTRKDGRRVIYTLRDGHLRRLVDEALNVADHRLSDRPVHD